MRLHKNPDTKAFALDSRFSGRLLTAVTGRQTLTAQGESVPTA